MTAGFLQGNTPEESPVYHKKAAVSGQSCSQQLFGYSVSGLFSENSHNIAVVGVFHESFHVIGFQCLYKRLYFF